MQNLYSVIIIFLIGGRTEMNVWMEMESGNSIITCSALLEEQLKRNLLFIRPEYS